MIEFRDVNKIYNTGTVAVKEANFKIEKGEFVFLVGTSGSGKSTLIKMILKEETPTTGKILINERDITNIKPNRIPYLRRSMGVVFQDFRLLPDKTVYENVAFAMYVVNATKKQIRRQVPIILSLVGLSKKAKRVPFLRRSMGVVFQDFRLLPDKTVYENVAFAMYIVKATPKHIRRQVPMVLSLVGLSGKAKMYPNELSGGEQQRVALARALVNNPSMIIADEPTGNLDPDTAGDIMNLLNEINLRGTTVVVATHAKEIVDQMKKRVIHINKGVIVKDDKKGGYDCEI